MNLTSTFLTVQQCQLNCGSLRRRGWSERFFLDSRVICRGQIDQLFWPCLGLKKFESSSKNKHIRFAFFFFLKR